METNKFILLLKRLHYGTKKGKIAWEATESDNVYQYYFPEYSIRISQKPSRSHQDDIDYYLQIFNQEGNLIEEITDTDYANINIDAPSLYNYMKDIYDGARRIAMGVERALDNILNELGPTDDEIPF